MKENKHCKRDPRLAINLALKLMAVEAILAKKRASFVKDICVFLTRGKTLSDRDVGKLKIISWNVDSYRRIVNENNAAMHSTRIPIRNRTKIKKIES